MSGRIGGKPVQQLYITKSEVLGREFEVTLDIGGLIMVSTGEPGRWSRFYFTEDEWGEMTKQVAAALALHDK